MIVGLRQSLRFKIEDENAKTKDCDRVQVGEVADLGLVNHTKELKTNVQSRLHKRTSLRLILDMSEYLYR